jgi:tetratricopeptide (TPR) repeat protein
VDGQPKPEDAGQKRANGFARATRWLVGRAPAARAFRIATVALLFIWAAVDQVHFWWSSEASALPVLQRAAAMNPYDSSVQVRLAHAEQRAGKSAAAVAAMERAAALSPANLAVQESYGRSLIEAGLDGDAYQQFQKIIARWPRNADALVNYGMLAHRLGHDGEAVDNWQRAVEVDPGQANAQLYLAQTLDQQGEIQAAARHYRSYLGIIAGQREKNPADAGPALAALVKVADADAAVSHWGDALQGYTAAVGFAESAGEKTLESLALVHLAEVQENQSDVRGAAHSYQRALKLDAGLSDGRSAASDWFNYAQFLRRQRQRETYVFAGLLHAENTLGKTPGEELAAIVDARKESETRLGKDAAGVRRNLETMVAEALNLQMPSENHQLGK